jgi:hypothetical protein
MRKIFGPARFSRASFSPSTEVWTPIYERFVVTASTDCSDAFGYVDLALGHFGREDNIRQSVIRIVGRDWICAGRGQPSEARRATPW